MNADSGETWRTEKGQYWAYRELVREEAPSGAAAAADEWSVDFSALGASPRLLLALLACALSQVLVAAHLVRRAFRKRDGHAKAD